MNLDYFHYVVRHFPRIFHGRHPLVKRAIPVGWYEVINALLKALDDFLTAKEASSFEVIYIAERSGRLQFVFESQLLPAREKAINELIKKFLVESALTCKNCGVRFTKENKHMKAQLCLICEALQLGNYDFGA